MEDRKTFERRMTETYPLLYTDMYKNPKETTMAFGFDVGPGWYDIVEELSKKLENLIKPIYENSVADPNSCCAMCGKRRQWHWFFYLIHTVKYFFMNKYKALKAYPKWRKRDKRFKKSIWYTLLYTLFKYKWYRSCGKWQPSYPKASQVKEKFAGIRFYMTWETNEMDALINEAEKKSYQTCETCGAPGIVRHDGWMTTLCDSCAKEKGYELE